MHDWFGQIELIRQKKAQLREGSNMCLNICRKLPENEKKKQTIGLRWGRRGLEGSVDANCSDSVVIT